MDEAEAEVEATREHSFPPERGMNTVLLRRRFHRTLDSVAKGSWIEPASKIVAILAVVGAATWTVFRYLDFEGEAAHVELDRARLELSRQDLVTRQAELSLSMLELERQIKGTEARAASQAPLEQLYQLSVRPLRHGAATLLAANLHVSVRNASKNLIAMPEGRLTLFIGTLMQLPDAASAVRLNPPSHDGPITWRQVDDKKYISVGENPTSWIKAGLSLAEAGGLAYGRLQTGETMELDNAFLINATDDSWFGYTTRFMVRQEGQPPWPYEYSGFVQIRHAKEQPATGGGSPNPAAPADQKASLPGR